MSTNRLRISLIFVLAIANYIVTAVCTALAVGIAVTVAVLSFVADGLEGLDADTLKFLLVVIGIVIVGTFVLATPYYLIRALVRFPRLRNDLEQQIVAETGAHVAATDEHRRIENLLAGLAIASGLSAPRFAVIEEPAPNSFGIGTNPNDTLVAVTTGLIVALTRDELEAILAYEVSRIESFDIALATWTVALTGDAIREIDDEKAAGGDFRRFTGFLPRRLAERLQLWALHGQARRRDRIAISFTRNPQALLRALRKLASDQAQVGRVTRATAPLWLEFPMKAVGPKPSKSARRLARSLDLADRVTALAATSS
ncbi:MAG: M48 family metalloprotease [Acidimicrobiia bacterium]